MTISNNLLLDSINHANSNPESLYSSIKLGFMGPHGNMPEEQKKVLVDFWYDFFKHILNECLNNNELIEELKIDPDDNLLQADGQTIRLDVSKSMFNRTYKQKVFEMLESKRGLDLSAADLKELQHKIEEMTMSFSEENMFSSCASLAKKMIEGNTISAKDFIKDKLLLYKRVDSTMNEVDTVSEIQILDQFGHHTLEALLIHVLGTVYSTENTVKTVTLIDRLEKAVRLNASIFASISGDSKVMDMFKSVDFSKKSDLKHPFGTTLVEFLLDRRIISLINKVDDSSSIKIIKKKKAYYLDKTGYAECLFNPSILPVKMNLPMVSPPREWKLNKPDEKTWIDIFDIEGGYLTERVDEQSRLLSSLNKNHFNIYFGYEKEPETIQKKDYLCKIMNTLQKHEFLINEDFLLELKRNVHFYVETGYLMPYYLNNINLNCVTITSILRDFYFKNSSVQKICTSHKLIQVLSTNVQRARFEQNILAIASAYTGYFFYLPAFLDFRGRIYRCGILHFHERDLARSLIKIAVPAKSTKYIDIYQYSDILNRMITSAAFHYKKFSSYDDAYNGFFDDCYNDNNAANMTHSDIAKKASLEGKNPFQFLSLNFGIFNNKNYPSIEDKKQYLNSYPITQDASASAYQIMSYFLMDDIMGKRTNLIPNGDGKIQDIYSFFRTELLEFFQEKNLNVDLYSQLESLLTRKLVKGIFMPKIYGKSIMSTNSDIKEELSKFLTNKECFDISRLCFQFWSEKYAHMDSLIRLIRIIGWFASNSGRPVLYQTEYFNTSQDYRKMEPFSIWVYDKMKKKRRKVTLRVPSDARDSRKTEVSTFVNFIHQKDAYIAMKVVFKMSELHSPIYTVHDNFITTACDSFELPKKYLDTIKELGPPLKIINEFLILNLFEPFFESKTQLIDRYGYSFYENTDIISNEILGNMLDRTMPEHFRKNKRSSQTWEKNVARLITYYNLYVKNVTNGSFLWHDHIFLWQKFKKKLVGEYCIHL